MSAITERVAAGAAFLDEHDPEWWRPDVERAIDLRELDLSATDLCVLGQRCPLEVLDDYAEDSPDAADRYWAYRDVLLEGSDVVYVFDWSVNHGFNAPDSDEFPGLTAEWKRVITERRAAA